MSAAGMEFGNGARTGGMGEQVISIDLVWALGGKQGSRAPAAHKQPPTNEQ